MNTIESNQYTIFRTFKSKIDDTQLIFMEYHETNSDESLKNMIKRKKIKNIRYVFKGYVEIEEDW